MDSQEINVHRQEGKKGESREKAESSIFSDTSMYLEE